MTGVFSLLPPGPGELRWSTTELEGDRNCPGGDHGRDVSGHSLSRPAHTR